MNLKGKKSFETSCSGWSRALEMCTVFLGTRGRAGLAQARGGPSHTCSLSSVGRGCHQACWLGLPSVFPEGKTGPGDSQFAQVTWSVVEQSSNLSLSLGGPLDSCARSPAPSLLSPTQLTWGRPVFCLQCAWTQKRKRPVVQPRAHPAVPECMSLQQSRAQCSARERPAPGSLSVSRGEVHLGRGPSPPLHYEVAVSVLQASRFKISHRGLGTKRILFQNVCDAVPSLEIQSLSYRSKGLTSGRLTRRVFTVLLLMSPVARTAVLGGGRLLSCPAAPQAGAELGCGPQGESAGLSGIPPGTCASREGDPSALAQALWAVAGLLCGPYSS